MFGLYLVLRGVATVGAMLMVGLFLLPTEAACFLMGSIFLVGGVALTLAWPTTGVTFCIAGVVLLFGGWCARRHGQREAERLAEKLRQDASRARRAMEFYIPPD
jgi:membrane protein implicated in regulation of membrane protease activity